MSEQYPLLNEEFSDEDKFSPRFQRRRPTTLRGRANYHMKGAAAIMTRWPEHWTSILTYWWIGLGMIALTTFIIYNTLFSIALLEPTNTRPAKYVKMITHAIKPLSPPAIFMHVFQDKVEEDLNNYLPYIEVFANKYKDFTYNLIIVTNDTNIDNNLSDETNINNALNALWSHDVSYGNVIPINTNIKVKYVHLSNYMDESPLKKYWKNLPHQFIQFLVRVVSVWDKGGIAINPDILTPRSPHATYVEKFVSIVNNFKSNSGKVNKQKLENPIKKHEKVSPRFNNILDILNALETEEVRTDLDQEILHAEESQKNLIKAKENISLFGKQEDLTTLQEKVTDLNGISVTKANTVPDQSIESKNESPNFLPFFMDYIFNRKVKTPSADTHGLRKRNAKTIDANNIVEDTNIQMRSFLNEIVSSDYKPVIVSAKGIPNDTVRTVSKSIKNNQESEKLFDLTVDLKGNIIATETPCHAFIGTIFTNAIHHDVSETLTDFIIKELSIFCKGLLASCMGIDVILV